MSTTDTKRIVELAGEYSRLLSLRSTIGIDELDVSRLAEIEAELRMMRGDELLRQILNPCHVNRARYVLFR